MAHSISARKRMRQNEKRRILNRARRATLKSAMRRVTDPLLHNDPGKAEANLKSAVKLLDREATRGLIHKNAAARTKSRLAKRIRKLKAKGATS